MSRIRPILARFGRIAHTDRRRAIAPPQADRYVSALFQDFLVNSGIPSVVHLLVINPTVRSLRTIAVAGTFLPAVADMAWAVCNSNNYVVQRYQARLDGHVHVTSRLPEAIVVPEPGQCEADSSKAPLERGKLYVYDRGFNCFSLINEHDEETGGEHVPRAHFVMRVSRRAVTRPRRARPAAAS